MINDHDELGDLDDYYDEILFADLEAGLASLLQNNVLRLQVAVNQPEQE